VKRAAYLAFSLASIAACGGPGAESPSGAKANLVTPFVVAFRDEARADPAKATNEYLAVVDAAAAAPASPWQMPVLDAALDALVDRSVSSFADVTPDAALAYRTTLGDAIEKHLASTAAKAGGPFAAGRISETLASMAQRRGDVAAAASWRAKSGCAQEAAVVGPLAWAAITGVRAHDALDRFDAPLAASYVSPGPFGASNPPVIVRGEGCAIPLAAPSSVPGVRDVVVDAVVPAGGSIGVELRTAGAAVLRVGGRPVLSRAYDLGGSDAVERAIITVGAGRVRIVARVGLVDADDDIEISAWGPDGAPLALVAPTVGSTATSAATGSSPLATPAPKTDDERTAFAAAALADDIAPMAEQALASAPARSDTPPEQLLLYARAVRTAADISSVQRAERGRAAYDRVLDAWPTSWEAILAHAVLAGVRRGRSEARIEQLRDLDLHRAKAGSFALPLIDAFEVVASGRDELVDRARAALERARGTLGGTPLFVDVASVVDGHVGTDRVALECSDDPLRARDRLDCYDALHGIGDRAKASAELARIRATLGAPLRFLPLELRDAVIAGDLETARRAFASMPPGEKTLSAWAVTAKVTDTTATREAFRALAPLASDAPMAIAPLLRAAGDDPTKAFDGVAERVVAQDRASPILPTAPTAVLVRDERYSIDATGLLHYVLFDVRRVNGTTDVDENAQASAPAIDGRAVARSLRRRILKKDGRVLEPDSTPNASQAHAELSQLEQGDAIEAIYEGWSLPGETGDLGIDTPDLLGDRTAVHDAAIELRVPASLHAALVSHALLGKGVETHDGDMRVTTWKMHDHAPRKIEEGVPHYDNAVAVSFSTAEWSEVGQALRETLASLEDHSPEIAAWARDAAGPSKAPSKALIEAVVVAAGKAVKESQPGMLSDFGVGSTKGPQTQTARTILTEHEGSRTWLITRALRELGVRAEVAISEDQPFSANPAFPPHFGRFTHPLVVAQLASEEIWIDSDVSGPPLPAGRISPELRGRSLVRESGSIEPVPSLGGTDEQDEIDVRLTLDDKGNAKGTFLVLLRGRDAQELAEAFYRVVGDERQRALRAVVLGWVPYANVDEVALSSTEGSWQVGVRAQISVGGYAQPQGAAWTLPGSEALHFVFPSAHVASLGATYASEGARESALAVNAAIQYHVHRRIELPGGASVTRAPGPFDVKSAHLDASRKISVSGGAIEDDFVLGMPTGTIPASEYGVFVVDAHKTDDAFMATTWVKPGT
jgi:hypothetical protein